MATPPHEEMDRRAVSAFAAALVDAGVPAHLRAELVDWFRDANAYVNHRFATPDDVPEGLTMPLVSRRRAR